MFFGKNAVYDTISRNSSASALIFAVYEPGNLSVR